MQTDTLPTVLRSPIGRVSVRRRLPAGLILRFFLWLLFYPSDLPFYPPSHTTTNHHDTIDPVVAIRIFIFPDLHCVWVKLK